MMIIPLYMTYKSDIFIDLSQNSANEERDEINP